MNPKIINLLQTERVCVLSTLLSDGSPHNAAMHFAFQENPLALYFSTHFGNRKLEGLNAGRFQASVCVGFSETDWTTLQMDGQIEKADPIFAKNLILSKYPESEKHMDDQTVFLKFTPAWWRYTDFKASPPLTISS
jgi:general stress protein 26